MASSPKDAGEDFVIGRAYSTERDEDLNREAYYQRQTGRLANTSNLPYILGGLGLAMVVILAIIFLPGSSDDVDRQQLQMLEDRIQELEDQLAGTDLADQTLARIDNNEKEIHLIMERLDRFEGTVTTQIDQIIKELGRLHQKTGSASAPEARLPPPDTKTTPPTKPKVHTVSQGETLYAISRRYGLTVEQLRAYNDIGKDGTIYPGQKLNLSGP